MLDKFMKYDVEKLFKHHPDWCEDEFLDAVIGEGDDGYDEACAEEMYKYFEKLQNGLNEAKMIEPMEGWHSFTSFCRKYGKTGYEKIDFWRFLLRKGMRDGSTKQSEDCWPEETIERNYLEYAGYCTRDNEWYSELMKERAYKNFPKGAAFVDELATEGKFQESSSFKRKREFRSHSMLESLRLNVISSKVRPIKVGDIVSYGAFEHYVVRQIDDDGLIYVTTRNGKKSKWIPKKEAEKAFIDGDCEMIDESKKTTKILTKEEFGKLSDLYSKCEWSSNEADFDRWNDYCEELGKKYIEDEDCLDYYLERYGQFVVPEKIDSFIYDVVEQGLANIEDDDEWEPLESYGKVYYALGDGDSQGNWQFVSDEFDTIEDAKKWRDKHGRPEYFIVKTNIGGAEPLKENKLNKLNTPKMSESKGERKSSLDFIVKTTTNHTKKEIEDEFDCTILALHRHRKEDYVIFIDDHEDGAACLYASDIREHFKPTGLEYVIVTYSNDKMCDAINSGKVDGIYTDLGMPGYMHDNPNIHLYSFSQDSYGKVKGDYYNSDLWTGLAEKDIEMLEKEVEEFNNTVGDSVLEIIERGSFEDSSDRPSKEELEKIGGDLGSLVGSDGEF